MIIFKRNLTYEQIEDVKTFIGITDSPEITYLESIWTQEVIDAYAQRMANAVL